MTEIIELPDNPMTPHDLRALESWGGHEISHGRATRFHWDKNENGDPVFELYKGGANEVLAMRIYRDRENHVYCVDNAAGRTIITGSIDHIMAETDQILAEDHGEDWPA